MELSRGGTSHADGKEDCGITLICAIIELHKAMIEAQMV